MMNSLSSSLINLWCLSQGFNCRVLAYDMYPSQEMIDIGVEYVKDIKGMLPQCKIVSLFCPLNESTFHIMNEEK